MREGDERIGVLRYLQDSGKPDRRNADIAAFARMSGVGLRRGIFTGTAHNCTSSAASFNHEGSGSVFLLVTSALGRSSVSWRPSTM